MDKTTLELCIAGLAGIGIGLFVGKRKISQLEAERDALETCNLGLKGICEISERTIEGLQSANKVYSDLLMKEKED